MKLQLDSDLLKSLRKYAQANHDNFTNEVIQVCSVPAPGFKEEKRARYVKSRMEDYGLETYLDDVNNVIAFCPSNTEGKPRLMFAAHIDTVFPEGTDTTVTRKGNQLFAPGIRDNSAGTAGIIMLAKALHDLPLEHGDIYLVGTVGEEGLGDLRGMKAAYKALHEKVDYVIGVDGTLGGMVYAGIGSRRLKVSVHTGGGHSWGAFGVPSAIHALGKMIAGISDLEVPKQPRTTYNVGVIDGGTSINTIAADASMLIDMRSVQKKPLMELEEKVRHIIDTVAKETQVEATIEVVGDRPVGAVSIEHKLVKTILSVLNYLDVPTHGGASSTDCNVPLSEGKPAVCLGVTTGKFGHRVDEILDIEPLAIGLEQLLLIVSAL